jgi:hypothetical protein
MFVVHHEFLYLFLPLTFWRFLIPNYATEAPKLWLTSFLLKEITNPTNTVFQKRKHPPPTQLCAFINLYSNTKLLKIPNNLITLEYP